MSRFFLDSIAADAESGFRLEFARLDGERIHATAIVIDGLADDRVAVVRIPEHLMIDGSPSLYEEMLLAFDAAIRRDSIPWRSADDPSIFYQRIRCIEYSHAPLDLRGISATADPTIYTMRFMGDAEHSFPMHLDRADRGPTLFHFDRQAGAEYFGDVRLLYTAALTFDCARRGEPERPWTL